MKKLLFPATFRGHLARQKLLLSLLEKNFQLVIDEFPIDDLLGDMASRAVEVAKHYLDVFENVQPDITLVRGDRFEVLPIAMLAAYRGGVIAHIEGGDLSGAIDNKVRHAITKLADYHFVTNKDSFVRCIAMGVDPERVFNFGSLDVEFADQCETKRLILEKYIVISFHPIPGESGSLLKEVLQRECTVITIQPNKDYATDLKGEEYTPEDYISLLKYAECLVGNSSSFFKEASVLGTSVVDIGERQKGRLKPSNVLHVPYHMAAITNAIDTQLRRNFIPHKTYYRPDTSKNILKVLKSL